MIRARNVSLLAAIGAIALLPACSDMMGGRSSSASSAAAAPAPQPVANAMVKQVQDRLQHDGYYKQGAVDGVWGSGTMNAVQAFQRDHSLAATGQLDVPTLQALNITDTGNAASTGNNPANTGPVTNPGPVTNTAPATAPVGPTYNTNPPTTSSGSTAPTRP